MAKTSISNRSTYGRRLNDLRLYFPVNYREILVAVPYVDVLPPDPRRVWAIIGCIQSVATDFFIKPPNSTSANGMRITFTNVQNIEFSNETSYGLCANGLMIRGNLVAQTVTVLECIYTGG